MSMAASMAGAAAFSTLPPMTGMRALSSPSTDWVVPSPCGARASVPLSPTGRLPTATVISPRREPSAAAGPHVCVSVTGSRSPTIPLTKSGKSSVGMVRLLTIRVSSPRVAMDTSCSRAPVALALRSWKSRSASMAKTSWGVAS